MAETAAVYARAAGEAADAGELAEAASRAASDAGGLDGGSLVDGEGRVKETAAGLQGNGEDIDGVVRTLVRAMNQAIDTANEVSDLIFADGQLNDALERHNRASVNEWNGWTRALQGAVAGLDGGQGDPPALTVSHGGESLTVLPTTTGGGHQYALPPELAGRIREKHLRKAAAEATTAFEEIEDAIEAYRGRLTEYGVELQSMGYDLAGPLGLWTTDGMAEYAAERLAEELGKEDPDERLLAMYTAGVSGIADALFGDANNPTDAASRRLTGAERAYLGAFYDTLGTDALLRLGALDGWSQSKLDLANGLAILTNPELGGLDPDRDRDRLPEAVLPFVYDYREGELYADGGLAGGAFQDELERFNAFGGLMSHATVASGDAFSEDLARAAVDIQRRASLQYGMATSDFVANTGSSGLLQAAALNGGVSAELLTDQEFREALLLQQWEDSAGAADLIRGGTTVPAGVDRDSAAAAPYLEAGREVLRFAGAHQDEVLGEGPSNMSALGLSDHTMLQGALADAALMNLGDVAGFGTDTAAYFSERDRHNVFGLMARTDESVNEAFKAGVNSVQYQMAYDHYAGAEGAMGPTNTFENIGRLTQLVNWGEHHAIEQASGDQRQTLITSLTNSSIGGALWAASVPSGPLQVPLGLMAAGYSAGVPLMPTYSAQAPAQHGDYELDEGFLNQQVTARMITAAAVDAANANGAHHRLPEFDETLYERAGAVTDQGLNDLGDRLGIVDDWRTAGVEPGRYVPPYNPNDRRAGG
ncbi:hypothetical protein [Streptomyces sp. 8K308]|uniref:hypothetical protein n=1 Tax=Streptomyces sp. 8K308 TaxID=2530388 RepID=UPI001404DF8C|nr:hypothetical protein [Streptomyces sp. 8K308]